MIKLKDIVKQLLTEETVQFCVAACSDTGTATVDKACYKDCRASGMATGGGGGGLLQQGPADALEDVDFGIRQHGRSSGRQTASGRVSGRGRVRRNRYRRG
jgi:hypothetical protein